MKRKSEYFQGCLIGGAIGDALGWPVEFMRYSQIKGKYGKAGIHDLVISSSGKAEITDDTQMTIFTAEGILRADSVLNNQAIRDEALAISVYFSLKYSNDFEKGLIASVNHDGDSDSTGAITGNILGAYLGLGKIPMKWMESVELKDVLLRLANELLNKSSN